jgi:hypothetical protein
MNLFSMRRRPKLNEDLVAAPAFFLTPDYV